jgi:hypothetical protein
MIFIFGKARYRRRLQQVLEQLYGAPRRPLTSEVRVKLTPCVLTSGRASHHYDEERGHYTYGGDRWMREMVYRKRDYLH